MAEPRTPFEIEFLEAVQNGLADKIKELLSLNLLKLNNKRYFDYYLIIKTLNDSSIDLAKLLVEKGFRVHKKSEINQEKTVLHAAIETRDSDFIATLLAKGASPDIVTLDEQNQTPFHLAIEENQLSTIELFLSHFDAAIFDEKYLLHYAIEKDNISVVSLLIAKGLSLKKKNESNSTPFCVALKNENCKILNILLSHCRVTKIELNNFDAIAPVYIAIICGNMKIIKKYVGAGLPINIPLKLSYDTWSSLNNYSGYTLLHFAVKHIKLEIVEFLLNKGADIFIKNENGSSPLHIAFETKEYGFWKTWQDFGDNNSVIDMILKIHAKFNSNPINKQGLAHFHIACSRDEPTIVEHFLKHGASVNRPVKPQSHRYKKYSPLHFAAKFRCKNTMDLLLRNGADVKQRDFQKMTALHIAAQESCLDVVSLLLQYGADIASKDSHGKTPVHWAYEKRNYGIIDLLLSVPNATKSNPTNSKGLSHFHIACTRKNADVVKSFIENGVSIDVLAIVDADKHYGVAAWTGYSPLHLAVSHNRAKIVQLLLDSGANVEIKNSNEFTPLHVSCLYTHAMFAEFIKNILTDLSKHGKINDQLKPISDIAKVTEVHFNGFSGSVKKIDWSNHRIEHMKIINSLLNHGADVNCFDRAGNAPVVYAYVSVIVRENTIHNSLNCSEALWTTIVESLTKELYLRRRLILNNLLKLNLNLDKCHKKGSILHFIVSNHENDEECAEMMELFLKKGANVNARDGKLGGTMQPTALHYATFVENKNLMSLLLEYNADVDCTVSRNKLTPLLLVTAKSKSILYDKDVIKILLDSGANPNARESNGRTSLHNLAMRYPSVFSFVDPLISTLVRGGADVDSRDSNGLTALHVACKRLNYKTLNALLKYGADVNVEDKKGRSVLCYLYKIFLRHWSMIGDDNDKLDWTVRSLQEHIIKMNVIGLPVSHKVLSSNYKIAVHASISDEDEKELIEKCQAEVQELRDKKIHDHCSLYDVMFKSENTLAQIVRNRTFKNIVLSKSFRMKYSRYGCLVQLKYQAGVDRANLLPAAKFLLNELVGMHLPDTCSENICKYFSNVELKETTEILRGVLNLKVDKSDDIQLRSRRSSKRQKVN